MAVKGQPIAEFSEQIVADIEATVKEVEKKVNPLTITIPDIAKRRTPLVLEHEGKVTIHGEHNPNLVFVNDTKKN